MGLIVIVLIIAVYIFRKHKKSNSVTDDYRCTDGNFRIRGTKKKFRIYKGKRFIFTVANGQIVSVIDKDAAYSAIHYGGEDDGAH